MRRLNVIIYMLLGILAMNANISRCYVPYSLNEPSKEDFLYSSNERIRYLGLNEYNFHARIYRGALPFFDKQDRYNEKYPWLSPYAYCAGNPVNKVDPNGLTDFYVAEDKCHKYVNDNRNQVIKITIDQYKILQQQNFDPYTQEYSEILQQGILDTNLLFTIENVLEDQSFVGHQKNCLDAAKKQNNSPVLDATHRIDMYNPDNNVYDYESGTEYIQEQLVNGKSIIAGVSYGESKNKHNPSTSHFLNIVGMGFEITENGPRNYYSYYDNARSQSSIGANLKNNRFYMGILKTNGSKVLIDKTNLGVDGARRYIVTELRRNRN